MLILASVRLHLPSSHLNFKMTVNFLLFKTALKDFHLPSSCQASDTYYSIRDHFAGASNSFLQRHLGAAIQKVQSYNGKCKGVLSD